MVPRRVAVAIVQLAVVGLICVAFLEQSLPIQQNRNVLRPSAADKASDASRPHTLPTSHTSRTLLQDPVATNTTLPTTPLPPRPQPPPTNTTPPTTPLPPPPQPPSTIPTNVPGTTLNTSTNQPPAIDPIAARWEGRDAPSPASMGLSVAVGGTLVSSLTVMGLVSVFGGNAAGALNGLVGPDTLTSLQATGAAFTTLVHHSQVFASFAQPLTNLNFTKIDSYNSFFQFANNLKWVTFDKLSPLFCKFFQGTKTECFWTVGYSRVLFLGIFIAILIVLHVVLVKVWECACARGLVLPALLVLPGAELAVLGLLALPLSQATTILLLNNDAKSRLVGTLVMLASVLYVGYLIGSLWLLVMQRQHGVSYIVLRRQPGLKGRKSGAADVDEVGEEHEQQQLQQGRSKSDELDQGQIAAPSQQSWEPSRPSRRLSRAGDLVGAEDEEDVTTCCDRIHRQWHGTWHVDVTPAQETLLRKQYLKQGCFMFFCRAYRMSRGQYDPATALEIHDRLSMLFWDYKGDSVVSAMWEAIRLLFRVLIGVIAAMMFVGLDYSTLAIVVAAVQGFYTALLLYFQPYRSRWVGMFEFLANSAQFLMYMVCGMLAWFPAFNPGGNILSWLQLVVAILAIIATLTRVFDNLAALEQLWYLMRRPRCLIALHGCLRSVFPCMKKQLNRMDTIAEDFETRAGIKFKGGSGEPIPSGGFHPPHPIPGFTPPIRLPSVKRSSATPRSYRSELSPYTTPRIPSDSTVHTGGEVTWTETSTQWEEPAPLDSARTSSTPGGTRMGGPGRLPSFMTTSSVGTSGLYRQLSDTRSYFTDFIPDKVEDQMTLGGAVDRDEFPELEWAQEARRGPLQDL